MKIDAIWFVLVSLLAVSVIVDCETTNGESFGSTSENPENEGTSPKIEQIGRFAVEEHNKKEKVDLQFVRVLSSREEVVAGKIYYVVLEARDGTTLKKYAAQVLSMSWLNIKQLQEFKPV